MCSLLRTMRRVIDVLLKRNRASDAKCPAFLLPFTGHPTGSPGRHPPSRRLEGPVFLCGGCIATGALRPAHPRAPHPARPRARTPRVLHPVRPAPRAPVRLARPHPAHPARSASRGRRSQRVSSTATRAWTRPSCSLTGRRCETARDTRGCLPGTRSSRR